MYQSTAEMLIDLRLMLGVTDKDELLTLILNQTGQKVLNETNQPTMPTMLDGVVVEMAADAFRLSQSDGAITGSVSSVSDNGQSVSYRESSVLASVSKTVKDYKSQLDRFRRTGW